jgi:hypothetical protein
MLRYMLFTNEARLGDPVRGDPVFVRDFEAAGKVDDRGRALRQLELDSRLMRYPCSYMIESDAFDALPAIAKQHVYQRLWDPQREGSVGEVSHVVGA